MSSQDINCSMQSSILQLTGGNFVNEEGRKRERDKEKGKERKGKKRYQPDNISSLLVNKIIYLLLDKKI